jgi:hypothetical protein
MGTGRAVPFLGYINRNFFAALLFSVPGSAWICIELPPRDPDGMKNDRTRLKFEKSKRRNVKISLSV